MAIAAIGNRPVIAARARKTATSNGPTEELERICARKPTPKVFG
jgi:hypothetical protein